MGQAIPKKIPNTKHGENKNDVGNFRWGVGGGRSMLRRVTEFKFLRFKDLRTGYTRAIVFWDVPCRWERRDGRKFLRCQVPGNAMKTKSFACLGLIP